MIKYLKGNKYLYIVFSLIALMFVALLAIRMGSVEYSYSKIFSVLLNTEMTSDRNILLNIRLPRIIVAGIVGANLAVAGALLQAVMQNPLADPGLTGVSAGSSLAAIIIMLLFPQFSYLVPMVSFLGGALACGLVYSLAWKNGIKPLTIKV